MDWMQAVTGELASDLSERNLTINEKGSVCHDYTTNTGDVLDKVTECNKLLRGAKSADIHAWVAGFTASLNKPVGQESGHAIMCFLSGLFHIRTPRGGNGEKAVAREVVLRVMEAYPAMHNIMLSLMDLLPLFGYWRDVVDLWPEAKKSYPDLADRIEEVLVSGMTDKETAVLACKFAPPEYSGKKRAGARAKALAPLSRALAARMFGNGEEEDGPRRHMEKYRKFRSAITKRSMGPEWLMASGQWPLLGSRLTKLPNKFAKLAKNAMFNLSKDGKSERSADPVRREGAAKAKHELSLVGKGEKTMAATDDLLGLLYKAYVKPYQSGGYYNSKLQGVVRKDEHVEAQAWALVEKLAPTMPPLTAMVDTSGSMQCPSGIPGMQCLDCAVLMGVFVCMAEKHAGRKQYLISFAESPTIFDCTKGQPKGEEDSWAWMVANVYNNMTHWGGSTNFEAAMKLVLGMLRKYDVPADKMPEMVVLSDMQFDCAQRGGHKPFQSLHQDLTDQFVRGGYPRLPSLIYWNLASTGKRGQPAAGDQTGCIIMGSFSVQAVQAFFSGKTASVGTATPREGTRRMVCLPRNDVIRDRLEELVPGYSAAGWRAADQEEDED